MAMSTKEHGSITRETETAPQNMLQEICMSVRCNPSRNSTCHSFELIFFLSDSLGSWKEGKRHGFGVFHIKKTGDVYRGNWERGLKVSCFIVLPEQKKSVRFD